MLKSWPRWSCWSIIWYKDGISSVLLVGDTLDRWFCLYTQHSTQYVCKGLVWSSDKAWGKVTHVHPQPDDKILNKKWLAYKIATEQGMYLSTGPADLNVRWDANRLSPVSKPLNLYSKPATLMQRHYRAATSHLSGKPKYRSFKVFEQLILSFCFGEVRAFFINLSKSSLKG